MYCCVSHSVVSDSLRPHGLQPSRILCPWNSPSKNTGVGSHSLFQGIFSTQGLTLGPLQCGQIIYYLSHQGSPQYKYMKSQSTQSNGLLVVDLWGTDLNWQPVYTNQYVLAPCISFVNEEIYSMPPTTTDGNKNTKTLMFYSQDCRSKAAIIQWQYLIKRRPQVM